jgi:hypothetical protein
MKYASSMNVLHENVLMKFFVSSLETSQRNFLVHSCDPKIIWSSTNIVEEFLRHCRPTTKDLSSASKELEDALRREGFAVDGVMTIDECEIKEEYHLPLAKESLKEYIDEEICQEDLDDEDPEETLMSIILLDEDDIIQPLYPLLCEVEEENNLNNEDFEDPVEATPTTLLPAHKEMVIFIHTDDLMKDHLEVVDEHIENFIRIGRHRWDMSCFIFYGYLIYDIEGHDS